MLNILCLDDNYLFLTSLASQLKNWGYSPVLSTNPKTALLEMSISARKSNPVHVLITGYHLGGQENAIDLCSKVISEFPGTYIVILTTDSTIYLEDFGGARPDIILNKLDEFQEVLFYSLKKLENERSSNIFN